MATKESVNRVKLIGAEGQRLDATTLARRPPGSHLQSASNLVPERGVLIARKAFNRIGGTPPSGISTPVGAKICYINGQPVVFGAWEHSDGSVRVYRYSHSSGSWSEVTTSGYRFSALVTNAIQFAQVKSGAEDIVLIGNGAEETLAYHVSEDTIRRQYYVERPEDDKLRIWYKPYSFGNSANGWFQLPVTASYPAYSADNAALFKLKDALATGGTGVGNGVDIQLEANTPTAGLKASVQVESLGMDFSKGYQLIFHVDSPSILLGSCRIEIGSGASPTWSTVYDPEDVTAYDRIDVNGNWIALSVRNIDDASKSAVKHIRFTWLTGSTVFLLTFAGFRLGGKISATTAYSSTYYDSTNKQESAPGAPQSSVPRTGGWWPGLYVGSYQLPFDPNFFYVFTCVHYASSQSSVDKARIYRQTPEGEWKHVGDMNDVAGSLDDNTPDLELTSTAVRPSPGVIPVPPAMFMVTAANRLVCANVVLPVPAGEETLLTTTALSGSPQNVSATAQPNRPCRLRIVGTTGSESGVVTFSGKDALNRPISDSVTLNGTNAVETDLVFATIDANGIALPAGSGSVNGTSGSYAQYSDRWYISRGDDPLRFARIPDTSDVWTGSYASTGGHAITALEVLQAGTGDRIIAFTADGNAYIYEGMDVSSLTTARERVPIPSVAPYAVLALPLGIAYIDADRRFRILGSSADVGYPIWAILEDATELREIFTDFTGKDLLLTYRTGGSENYDSLAFDVDTGIWKSETSRFVRQIPVATRTGDSPNVYYQDVDGRFVIPYTTELDADLSSSPTQWLGIPISLDTGTVDLAGPNRTATVFGIWAEFDGLERKIGSTNQWARSGANEISIGYDVTSDITPELTQIFFPEGGGWRTVTSATYSAGVTRVTFTGSDITAGYKTPSFSLDMTFRLTAIPSEEQYEVSKAFTGSARKQWRHAVRADTRFRVSAVKMEVEAVVHANWVLYAAGVEAEVQELDPYE